jgi:hypothetical protein
VASDPAGLLSTTGVPGTGIADVASSTVAATTQAVTEASHALAGTTQQSVDAIVPVAGGGAAGAAAGNATQALADGGTHAAEAGASTASHLTDAVTSSGPLPVAVDATAHQLASAPAILDGTAHTGVAIGTTTQLGGDAGIPALGGGGPHIDLPPLDPMLLRYMGLAGFLALSLQAAVRWTNAVSSCGVPTRLALRNFRLLPCLAVSSGERVASAALAVASGKPSGLAGGSAIRRSFARPSAGAPTRPTAKVAGASSSRSGAGHMFEIMLLAVLVAINVVLISVRDVFRRENRG